MWIKPQTGPFEPCSCRPKPGAHENNSLKKKNIFPDLNNNNKSAEGNSKNRIIYEEV